MKKIIFPAMVLFVFLVQSVFSSEFIIRDIRVGRNFIIDQDQNIYTHYDDHSIVKYSPKGKQLIVIGRKGEGPGDIKRIGWFAINPKDSLLYVTERANGNRRISKFSIETGKYAGNWEFDFDWLKWEGIAIIDFDSNGNAYLEAVQSKWRKYKSFTVGALEKAVFKYSYEGKKVNELFRIKSDFMAEKAGKGNITIPHSDYLYWKLLKDKIAFRVSSKPYIDLVDLNGASKKRINIPFKAQELTDKDLDNWIERLKTSPDLKKGIEQGWFDIKFWRRKLPFPEYKIISSGPLYVDSNGFLYSKKLTDNNQNIWAIINTENGSVRIKHYPANHKTICMMNGYTYTIVFETQDDGYISVRREDPIEKHKSSPSK